MGISSTKSKAKLVPAQIAGNVSDEVKILLGDVGGLLDRILTPGTTVFGESIGRRFKVVEISVNNKADEPSKPECRYVVEIDVTQDMLNGWASLHGGCAAFLLDLCTTFAIHILQTHTNADVDQSLRIRTASQSINIIYHAPAVLGEKLRIISTTMTLGSRALTARGEIWSVTHHRLVASATHIKMVPSVTAKL